MSGFQPGNGDLDQALRSALHLAVDSVEPGTDGLDQIQAKIAARQAARSRLRLNYRFWQYLRFWRRRSQPDDHRTAWVLAALAEVSERFRPDPGRPGWFSWLRPAAAVITGLFVVGAAGLAVAALPAAINNVTGHKHHSTPGGHSPSHSHTASGSQQSYPSPGIGNIGGAPPPIGSQGAPNPAVSPSCTNSPTQTPTISPSSPPDTTAPSTNPSTSASTPPDTNTPSPPASSANTTPSPAAPTSPAVPASSASPNATGKALLSRASAALDDVILAPVDPSTTPTPTVPPPADSPAPTGPPVRPKPCFTP